MKLLGVDWKFLTGTVLALVAVAVGIYYPQVELNGKSLAIHLISSSSLQAPADSKVNDLQVTVNGIPIESPYISSLLLINNGEKPIMSTDFETPLQIRTLNDAKLITAQVTGSEPFDIPVKVFIDHNQLKISPFLSNPKDKVSITVVSSGPLNMSAQARIAGVPEVVVEDMSLNKSRPIAASFSGALAVLCLGLYLFFLPTPSSLKAIVIGLPVRLLSSLGLFISGVYFVTKASEDFSHTGDSSLLIMLPMFLAGAFVTYLVDRINRAGNSRPSILDKDTPK